MRKLLGLVALIAILASLTVPAFAGGKAEVVSLEVPFYGDRDGNRLADDLDGKLERAGSAQLLPVVVRLSERVADRLADLEGVAGKFQMKAQWDAALNGFAADLTPGQIKALSKCPFVERIDYDREYTICLGTATQWAGVKQARLDWGVNGDRDGSATTYSKNDVVICVIDTGIYTGHVDLDGGKVIGWKDYVN
ncbi:MAG: protease inhibitor I9 family protein, partial [Firmicutes bacterium]|nr:protease inhibitor I9 family protein [Bacillota bacterium]